MTKDQKHTRSVIFLWLTGAIWGFAFVAQKEGMSYIGPFTYNGIRFLLGSLSLVPLLYFQRCKSPKPGYSKGSAWKGGLKAGIVLFIAASLQQAGMIWTTAGKAGFITGLYIVLVPIIGIVIGQHIRKMVWMGMLLAISGLFLLTIKGNVVISKGDLLVLISALFWAMHVQLISHLVAKLPPIVLSAIQFLVCGILSLITAGIWENISTSMILDAAIPILYGGIMSVGIAYTLQVVAQQHVSPTFAGLVLSFETVFAVIGGRIFLNETLTLKAVFGCLLMLGGMLLVQKVMQNQTVQSDGTQS